MTNVPTRMSAADAATARLGRGASRNMLSGARRIE
jgi:hypothetical protein